MIALEAACGSIRWTLDFPSAMYNSMASLVDGAVVIADASGGVYKLALATGKAIWEMPAPVAGSFTTGGAILGPDSTIYVTSNVGATPNPFLGGAHSPPGIVSAYDLASGRLKWRTNLGAGNTANVGGAIGRLDGPASPLTFVIPVGPNPTLALGTTPANGTSGPPEPAKVVALDAATGALVWEYAMPLWHGPAAGDYIPHLNLPDSSANPAIGGDGTVYVAHEDGAVYAIKDRNGDREISEDEVSSYNFHYSFQGSPALARGLLAVSPSNGLAVFDAEA